MNQGIQGCLNHELLSDVYITDAHIAPRVLRHVVLPEFAYVNWGSCKWTL